MLPLSLECCPAKISWTIILIYIQNYRVIKLQKMPFKEAFERSNFSKHN